MPMPRVAILRFPKEYTEVVEAFKALVKDAIVTEREEHGHAVVDIEGHFEQFVLEDMDMWGGYLKFEIQDNRVRDGDDTEARAIIVRGIPELGSSLFSPTIGHVYRRMAVVTRITTITEKILDEVVLSRDEQTVTSEPAYEWEEITREFAQKVNIR